MNDLAIKMLAILLMEFAFLSTLHAHGDHSVPCSGPHKNDPECVTPAPPSPEPAISVNSATVDWLNEKIIVRGGNFSSSTTITLAGVPATIGDNWDADQIEIPFNDAIAAEVTSAGNYNLEVNGSVQFSVYIESQIVDPAASGCPCTTDWETKLEATSLWRPTADCLEIEGPGLNDIADISGTIVSASSQYPISASFYPGVPDDSVCRLVQVDTDLSVVDLVNRRINEQQQSNCATVLRDNVCATVNGL